MTDFIKDLGWQLINQVEQKREIEYVKVKKAIQKQNREERDGRR